MRTKAMRLCRLRGALSSSASASSSPSVHPGASSGLSAKPTSTEVLKPLRVLGSAGFGEMRRPGVGFANLGATSCPASVRLVWAGRFGASCEKVEVSYRQFLSFSWRAESFWFYEIFDKLKPLSTTEVESWKIGAFVCMLSLKSRWHFQRINLKMFNCLPGLHHWDRFLMEPLWNY